MKRMRPTVTPALWPLCGVDSLKAMLESAETYGEGAS